MLRESIEGKVIQKKAKSIIFGRKNVLEMLKNTELLSITAYEYFKNVDIQTSLALIPLLARDGCPVQN